MGGERSVSFAGYRGRGSGGNSREDLSNFGLRSKSEAIFRRDGGTRDTGTFSPGLEGGTGAKTRTMLV